MITRLWSFMSSCHYQVTKSSDYHSTDFNVATDWYFHVFRGPRVRTATRPSAWTRLTPGTWDTLSSSRSQQCWILHTDYFQQLLILIMIEYNTWHKVLQVDQTWLSQQTEDWTLNITFCNNVTEFKVRTTPVRRQGRKCFLYKMIGW